VYLHGLYKKSGQSVMLRIFCEGLTRTQLQGRSVVDGNVLLERNRILDVQLSWYAVRKTTVRFSSSPREMKTLDCCIVIKVKGKGPALDIALLRDEHMLRSALQSHLAADWHELMIPQRIMRPSIARSSEQWDPRCSTQTYHRPNHLH